MTHAHLRKYLTRRCRGARLMIVTGIFAVGYLCSLTTVSYSFVSAPTSWNGDVLDRGGGGESLSRDKGHFRPVNDLHEPISSQSKIWMLRNLLLPSDTQEKNADLSPPLSLGIGCVHNVFGDVLQHPQEHHQALDSSADFIGKRRLLADNDSSSYPNEIFSIKERRRGAVILHITGMIYMFIALAIVCDEFFVPALGVITEKLDISEDVSGATFMAAGGSAPELFTSIIGVFIARNDVGIGTIVGSAVFNILFVIGMCALFSKEVLSLTWWPLFRDVTFYSVSLLFLIGFFSDESIEWWESLVLFLCYIAYVTFMKFNSIVEVKVKACLRRCKCTSKNKVNSSDHLLQERIGRQERSPSMPFIHSGSGHYRHGMVQLMIHTIDPLTEAGSPERVHDKAMQLQATLQVIVNPENGQERQANNNHETRPDGDKNMHVKVISNGKMPHNGNTNLAATESANSSPARGSRALVTPKITTTPAADVNGSRQQEGSTGSGMSDGLRDIDTGSKVTSRDVNMSMQNSPQKTATSADTVDENTLEEEEEPLDMSWPDGWRKRITYVFLAPIVFPLYLTLPDVRRPDRRKFFPVTFVGSICWIAGFSYLMVWWANQTGETIGIPDEVMGLTILAAGTSIPDLITSVIVAKKGFGDMAVSSSVGSNIFDITVG
ncbi:sodium/potassium/calcium exchanger 2 [Plakobranchus ocellatus]|uniref:Sodium/potassium/calcium exchanger 2 n=1 Tax=Plakobranchus ocellatus TaxID=259542 RepID=A0AAV3Z8V8_9GAST|nr:sodium/potassium/calcium exchanger 2 [Plakobranchus ocellatus]